MEFSLGAGILHALGPIILTDLGITDMHAQALKNEGLNVPERIRCRFLVDTGATFSLVKHEIAEKAGLKLINSSQPIHGIGVDSSGRIYVGRIWFICQSKIDKRMTHVTWVDTKILSGELAIDTIDGLIGRDVLSHFNFTYFGKEGKFTLKYLKQ